MTLLQQAKQEWEVATKPYCKKHPISKFRPAFHIHEFRQYGKALAMLNWTGQYIEITKLETIEAGKGEATRLITFLKSISDKYQIPLCGHARKYDPDSPIPSGHLLTKEQLESFYVKQGFKLRTLDDNTSDMLYLPQSDVHAT